MKYFICADVHGNIRALDAVLALYEKYHPCMFLFLGDCVGYGPHPDSCLEKILAVPDVQLIMGNHEWALLNRSERTQLNSIAAEALVWSERLLDGRFDRVIREKFLFELENKMFLAAHSSPYRPEEWAYIFNYIDADEAFYGRDFNICFIGHTHIPALFTFNEGEKRMKEGKKIKLDPADRYIINPGSVGQPRDMDPRAACCVFDSKKGTIELLRCEYDVEAEVKDFYEAGLPKYLGERLLQGM